MTKPTQTNKDLRQQIHQILIADPINPRRASMTIAKLVALIASREKRARDEGMGLAEVDRYNHLDLRQLRILAEYHQEQFDKVFERLSTLKGQADE